jgi:hypothetical protein
MFYEPASWFVIPAKNLCAEVSGIHLTCCERVACFWWQRNESQVLLENIEMKPWKNFFAFLQHC